MCKGLGSPGVVNSHRGEGGKEHGWKLGDQ